jgi:Ni/Fe-hydrogenase subunit HybB-like protein
MLLDHNWARWLALAWMVFHVAISFPVLRQMAVHSIIFAVIAWLLFRPDAGRYYASSKLGDE